MWPLARCGTWPRRAPWPSMGILWIEDGDVESEALRHLADLVGQAGRVEPAGVGDDPHAALQCQAEAVLDLADDSVVGIIAFWSVIHVPDQAMSGVLEQFPLRHGPAVHHRSHGAGRGQSRKHRRSQQRTHGPHHRRSADSNAH